jgi:signal transduction histidine kinase
MRIKTFFENRSLKTKLLFMMLFLSFLSIVILFTLYTRSERALIERIEKHTLDLSNAIQISVEELTTEGRTDEERLTEYLKKLNTKGVKEVSIISNEEEVIASSNPRRVGMRLNQKRKDYMITARLGENLGQEEKQKTYNIIIPVVVGNEQWGYIHINMLLDDFSTLLKSNYLKRFLATLFVFGIGIGVALFLSDRYTQPIQQVVNAANKVASGDLSNTLPVDRKDEIGNLMRTFNEMVERLRTNRVLEERLIRAEHLSKVGQLASGIAHEIRNPLNMINLSIDHMKEKYLPEDSGGREGFVELVSRIKEEIQRLNRLTGNFLDYSKPLKLNRTETDMKVVIDDTVSLIRELAEEQRIIIKKDFINGIPEIFADREQIKECLMNILLNSFQAMPDGGEINIKAIAQDSKFVAVTISDTGIGIPLENMDKIFEPYFTTKRLGIGLGLSVTKRIIEEHSGKIEVESNGVGTSVKVMLPV